MVKLNTEKLMKTKILFWILILIFSGAVSAQDKKISVDFGKTEGKIRHNALGFLHALGRGRPGTGKIYPERLDDIYLKPINPKWYRMSENAIDIYLPRIRKYNPCPNIVISISGSYIDDKNQPLPWTDNFEKWSEVTLRIINECEEYGVIPIIDVCNEPEQWLKQLLESDSNLNEDEFWDNFNRMCVFTFNLIRKNHPEVKVTGPGYGYPDLTVKDFYRRFGEFIDACVKENALPDYFNYHFPHDQVENHMNFANMRAGKIIPFLITEYLGPHTYKMPAANFQTFAYYESLSQVEGAMRATWIGWGEKFGTLGGCFGMDTPVHRENSKYFKFATFYCYVAYAAMTGNRYSLEAEKPVYGLAGDISDGYRILIGSQDFAPVIEEKSQGAPTVTYSGKVTVKMNNLKNGKYTIILQEIVQPGSQEARKYMYTSAEDQPAPALKETIEVKNTAYELEIDWTNPISAWYIDIVPDRK